MTLSETVLTKPLTGRQVAVLNGLMAGESNLQIAEQLNLTEFTIKYHCRGLYHCFGVTNRHELLSIILQLHGKKVRFEQTEDKTLGATEPVGAAVEEAAEV